MIVTFFRKPSHLLAVGSTTQVSLVGSEITTGIKITLYKHSIYLDLTKLSMSYKILNLYPYQYSHQPRFRPMTYIRILFKNVRRYCANRITTIWPEPTEERRNNLIQVNTWNVCRIGNNNIDHSHVHLSCQNIRIMDHLLDLLSLTKIF